MSADIKAIHRKAAKAPAPRTVTVTVEEGDFSGWSATARADFPMRVLADLESGSIGRIMDALDRIVEDHNLPDSDGNIATSMQDVEPYGGVLEVASLIFDAIGKLPNR